MGSANIYLQNTTDSPADLVLSHTSTYNGTASITGLAVPPGGRIGPLSVGWDTTTPADLWYASISVSGGSQPGMYVSYVSYDLILPYWKECLLVGEWDMEDDGSSPTFTANWNTFSINLNSGGTSAPMLRIGDYSPVQNVFVLMLENHSFDNILAFSGINGITHATTQNNNSIGSTTYNVSDTATPLGMPTDPGHEFADILQQLCGPGMTYTAPNYPAINLTGFAATYSTSADEQTGLPTSTEIGDIMACFAPGQLPVTTGLAARAVVCDQWFSSLPGPTWPNRFYLHGASSAFQLPYPDNNTYVSLDDSPNTTMMAMWESVDGFTYRSGSIFDALTNANIPWQIYHDDNGQYSCGAIPQVCSLQGISLADPISVQALTNMPGDLQGGYPYRYTFIEPNYGDTSGNTYVGGSSQHPMDSVLGGEGIIAYVFNTIFSSPIAANSLLIVTYDEHGGFYDSVTPGSTVPPNTSDVPGVNGFIFNQLGVRVPALIVSPRLVQPGVDHTVYDHSSVLATLERLFGLPPLTSRDAVAHDFIHLIGMGSGESAPLPVFNVESPSQASPLMTPEERMIRLQEPLPQSGNLIGTLAVARKTDIELSSGTSAERAAINARVQALQTRGDADDYITEVMEKVRSQRADHQAAVKAVLSQASSTKKRPNPS
jgi:phospholipase C